jgi:hypothetical protein
MVISPAGSDGGLLFFSFLWSASLRRSLLGY